MPTLSTGKEVTTETTSLDRGSWNSEDVTGTVEIMSKVDIAIETFELYKLGTEVYFDVEEVVKML